MLTARVCQAAFTIAAGLSIVLGTASAVYADFGGGVESDDDSVEVEAEFEEEQPGADGSEGSAGDGGGAEDQSGDSAETSVPSGQCPNWAYELVDSESGTYKGASAGERPSEKHQLLGRWCRDPHTGLTMVGAEWVLPGEDGTPVVDPRVLAQQAVDSLRLPKPNVAASPESAQLVRLPVWLWLEGASWESQSASASVPGLTVTAEAVPTIAAWDMGDGTTIECTGPGTPWTEEAAAEAGSQASEDEAESPDCGHTYTQPSEKELQVSVTVTWEVTWSGGGESGSVPDMVTTASASWPVTESHSLVTR
jgi:hypothetical protein